MRAVSDIKIVLSDSMDRSQTSKANSSQAKPGEFAPSQPKLSVAEESEGKPNQSNSKGNVE